ncbi:MAG TPA: flagellar hook-associated protein FlgK [Terracidiphilus sp.]|nr:flagellar hook-associated protein FlgK [Terracidiphilus sp.]
MGTISSAFNIISQALEADQGALSIVANNVANSNTTGYTRQVPNWQENPPVVINGVSYGAGVTETGPTSVRDRVLEQRLAQQQQLAAGSGAQLTALNTLQTIFTPNSGASGAGAGDIGSDLTSFFNSFASLEANPTDNALRQQVLSSAATLAGDVSNGAASLSTQQSALDQEAAGVTLQVNALTQSIAQLNKQIQSLGSTGNPGALQDQRQQDLSQLSQLIGINQVTTENNGLSITTASGQLLVSEGTSVSLTNGTVGGVTHFFLGGTDVTSQLTSGGGQLGGYLTARDQNIPNAQAALDQLAYNVSTAVNTQNNAGTDLAGDNGGAGNIFYQPSVAAGSAATMAVLMTDPNHIAAAASGAGTGDNSNAVALAGLANQAIVGGQTPTNFFAEFVTQLGSQVAEVQTENTAQNASVTQLQNQRDALSSVNLNDEAASMQQFERSYQAASQVFNLLNTVLSSALNLGVQTAVS